MQEEESKIKGEKIMSESGIKDSPLTDEQLTILKVTDEGKGVIG